MPENYKKLVKVFRVCLLLILVVAVAYIGVTKDLRKLFQWQVIIIAIVAAIPTLILNALILRFLVSVIDKNISYVEALNLASLSVFGNSLGIPIGSGAKYYILYSRHNVNPLHIMVGNLLIAVVTGVLFLACSLCIKLFLMGCYSLVFGVFILTAMLFGVFAPCVKRFLPRKIFEVRYFTAKNFSKIILLSFVGFCLYMWWYGIIIYYCFDELDYALVSGVSLSLGFGLISGLTSVAGYHETVVAFVSNALGIQWYRGAELALIYRVTALMSSSLMLLLFVKKYIAIIREAVQTRD